MLDSPDVSALLIVLSGAFIAGFATGFAGFGTAFVSSGLWFHLFPAAMVPPPVAFIRRRTARWADRRAEGV